MYKSLLAQPILYGHETWCFIEGDMVFLRKIGQVMLREECLGQNLAGRKRVVISIQRETLNKIWINWDSKMKCDGSMDMY